MIHDVFDLFNLVGYKGNLFDCLLYQFDTIMKKVLQQKHRFWKSKTSLLLESITIFVAMSFSWVGGITRSYSHDETFFTLLSYIL